MENRIKASSLKILRHMFATQYKGLEPDFLKKLTPELAAMYRTSLPITWNPVTEHVKIIEAAAQVLYPADSFRLRTIGYVFATESLGGMYKIFFAVPKLEFVINRTAQLWALYNKLGQLKVKVTREENGKKVIVATLSEYPDFSPVLREMMAGYYRRVCELTGGKNINVEISEISADGCQWIIQMEG
jgi:hypothetical protein